VHSIGLEASPARGSEAAMLDLRKIRHFRCAAAVDMPRGRGMKLRNMVGQLIHYFPIEATRPRESVEQQALIEAPHHNDPIERLTVRSEIHGAISSAKEATNVLVKRRRGAAVQSELGLAGTPTEIHAREVEIRVFYRALQLEDALTRDKDQRGMGL